MKIKRGFTYKDVLDKPKKQERKPNKPSFFFRTLIRTVSIPDLLATGFKYESIGMDKLSKKEPCLILMNHSSFIDLEIVSRIFYPRKYNIVCTSDGFIGKDWLMRQIGCIPTKKFVSEISLLHDMMYAVKRYNSSILMYPEASYSFDGTATPLPESLGRCIKMLGIPVVVVKTEGAFARDPLYNNRQKRKVKVSATAEYLLSPEDIKEKSPREINDLLKQKFSFDNFLWQQQNGVKIDEPFRADYLNRALYKCPHCLAEGKTEGKGTILTCHACGKQYELTEQGYMRALDGETEFAHVPDWYDWERKCVREEIERGEYNLDVPVDIYAMVDTECIYELGEGRLTHSREGFHLTGCDGELDYVQKPLASYSLYADYYWYKLGDIICIGTKEILYYCFPKGEGDVVAKTRLAAEELYKIVRAEKRTKPSNEK
ncbi:MAG: 1-acyl-sn-glycerol-3-phosphate acyltransferase [Ruminococcaceae bacterium]|nr:1-acyl-sn-glycerol-3-phosphate acyltransferase [Oscillospiraceae bacterium]